MNRRSFLRGTAGACTAGFWVPNLVGRAAAPSPNDKLSHACIGVGGMGRVDLNNLKAHPRTQIVAVCDVDTERLSQAAAVLPGVRTYSDWRELLLKEGDRIDSVNICVPDHMHAVMTMSALRAGKHVYCQKPLCHDVAECRAIARAAGERSGLVTQLGTQYAAGIGNRMAVRMMKEDAVGAVQRVVLCSTCQTVRRIEGPRPAQGSPPPATLNWDHWLGTAAERPYAPDIYHPVSWRAWLDFGTGCIGDNGCHIFDAVWKGLGLTAPLSVTAEVDESWRDSSARRADNWPPREHITWVFAGNEKTGGKEFTLEWFHGWTLPSDVTSLAAGAGFQTYPQHAAMVFGAEGALLLPHGSAPRLLPKTRFENYPKVNLAPHPNHYEHFLDACLGGEKTESDFVRTGPMVEAILLGCIAVLLPGTVLRWDAKRMEVVNSAEANRLLRRAYRKGWEFAGLG